MNRKTVLKLSPIAASLMFALGSSMAYAAAPAAGVLPGAFNTNVVGVTYTSTASNAATITTTNATTVLQWGGSSVAVPNAVSAPSGITTVAGFNIGSGATLTLSGVAAGSVLVSDLTGQASQIFGAIGSTGNAQNLYIANPNGVVLGGTGSITAANQALLGYAQDPSTFTGSVAVNSATISNKGDVTVSKGATVNAGYLLVAGAGNVNVDAGVTAAGGVYIAAGVGATATAAAAAVNGTAYTTTAVLNLSGTGNLAGAVGAAGAVNIASGSTVTLGVATTIGGTLTNAGAATVANNAFAGDVVNNNQLNLSGVGLLTLGGALTNNGTMTVAAASVTATGGIVNAGLLNLAAVTATTLATGTKAPAAISNSGQISANGLTVGTAASFSNTGILNLGANNLSVTAGTINLGGVVQAASGTAKIGQATLAATSGNLTVGTDLTTGNVSDSYSATKGSAFLNSTLTAGGTVSAAAMNQVVVGGAINATGNVSLSTTNTWTAPYSLGVVIQPGASVSGATVTADVATADGHMGNMLAYGDISASGVVDGFTYTGNSFYQGAGAQIKGLANFGYSGVITGGIDPVTKTQGSDPFKNAVVVNGGATSTITLNPGKLGTANQNTNVMGVGATTLAANLGTLAPIFAGGSAVINTGFVSSNLFARAQGGNLTLNANGVNGFYWPGLAYLSTVKSGMLATVDTSKTITIINGGAELSNAIPMQVAGGQGVYLMSGTTVPTQITTNTNSNISLLNPALVGVVGKTAAAPTGSVLTFSEPLATTNLVAFTPPAE
jgi:filamentous hemagglutinin family protein